MKVEQFVKLAAVTITAAVLGGCTAPQTPGPKADEPPTVLGEFAKLDEEKGNWMSLTPEQRMEDFDYLYQTLTENFPYIHVIKRMIGKDINELYQQYRSKEEYFETDAKFFAMLEQFTRETEGLGHFNMLSPFEYADYAEMYSQKPIFKKNPDNLKRWSQNSEVLHNETTVTSYTKMAEVFYPVYDEVMEYYENLEKESVSSGLPQNQDVAAGTSNVETKILEQGKIAYIAVNSLATECYERDKEILFNFYKQIKDYPHVIFDFTQNGGGNTSYFNDLIVAPNIDEVLAVDVYWFMKDGDYNKKFVLPSMYRPISEAPSLPQMNPEDFADFGLFREVTHRVTPLSWEKELQGKLWILVSKRVFSSSEYAAMFSKATGFAALVGTSTGGDGLGPDPLIAALPNSGFLFRYSSVYGTTPDGTSSQEFGTEPDIISPEGETPLETCLKAIAELG